MVQLRSSVAYFSIWIWILVSSAASRYGGIVPKKKPLISKDGKRAFFDSADWALDKYLMSC
ncbi:hypothetical protein EJ110_NYTH49799 [Nymphaea thermarum]|nr:hypothetical protein EJ110_NYTH49799 [Nymphaea thermarum]